MDFNSLFFPAPRDKYTCLTHFGEMLYLPKRLQTLPDGSTTANLAKEDALPTSDTIYIPCLLIKHKQLTPLLSKPELPNKTRPEKPTTIPIDPGRRSPASSGETRCTSSTGSQGRSTPTEKAARSPKIIVYFHGNAEDVSTSYDFSMKMSITFRCHVMAVEYPGYGLYQQESSSAETILENARLVVEYLTKTLRYEERDIVLVGRSMGTGPACFLASNCKNLAALILISPYTSLKAATRTLLGSLASMLVRERFDNLTAITKVRCPTLIIHGQSDTLIPESHAIELHQNCAGPSKLIMPKNMTHNDYDIHSDLVKPIQQFFTESNITMTLATSSQTKEAKQALSMPPSIIIEKASPKDVQILQRMIKQIDAKRVH